MYTLRVSSTILSHVAPDTRLFPLEPSWQSQKEVLVHIRGSNGRGHASASELSGLSVGVRSVLETLSGGETLKCVWGGRVLTGGENIYIRYPMGDIRVGKASNE